MKIYPILTLLGVLGSFSLYGQMDHSMHSPNSKMDQSNKPVIEPMQGMNHSTMPMNDKMQMEPDKNENQKKNDKNKTQTPPKGVLRYPSVITPNVGSLPWTMDGDVKVFHLIAEPIQREFSPGFWVNCWGYNGSSPGPTIEAVEGDRVRILVTNKLNELTTVHWHGIILPNGMDGVAGLNQKGIPPGDTFKYEFTLVQNGTFMYHPHADEMFQIALGMEGFFIIHPKDGDNPPVDRDFAIFLHEWRIPMGAKTPMPFEMLDFNLFTFNSVLYPTVESLVVKKGDRVRIRFGNVMMNSHPIHLHGHEFLVTRRGGKRLPLAAQYSEVTVVVSPGETRDIELIADNPGDWALHCHKSHHVMNQMQHDMPNLTGINKQGIEERIREFFPDFMGLMNINGMGDMFEMYGTKQMMDMGFKMKYPPNLSPIGSPGSFGVIEMGSMFTIFKVRDNLTSYADPGWYQHPPGTVAESVNATENKGSHMHGMKMQNNMNMDNQCFDKTQMNHYPSKMKGMQHDMNYRSPSMPNMPNMNNMKNTSHSETSIVSWFSKEENKQEPQHQKGNWMQSKPEDSMGSMHGGHDMKKRNMQGMFHDMNVPNQNESNQMQSHMGH